VARAGYSGRPLADKLGIKPGMTVCVLGAPANYQASLGFLPDGITWLTELGKGECDFIHFFTKDKKELETLFPELKKNLATDGMLWVSWPKMAAEAKTDLKEPLVMEVGLANGLVDVKVAAIDDTWSGLKFVRRLKDR
jgi:hypothetical protein